MMGSPKKSKRGANGPLILGFAWLCVYAAGAAPEAPALRPGRIVTNYALTAPAHQDPDQHEGSTPKDWQLLGSNDDGRTWQTVDARTNELFSTNHLRRVFAITNRTAYNIYRLEVTRTRDETDTASLAEMELMGPVTGLTNEAQLRMKVSSSRAHPLRSPATQAFDGDPATDWFDFGLGPAGGRWLQCQYTTNADTVVDNIAQLILICRSYSMRDSFAGQASQVLFNSLALSNGPVRKLVGYSLTSANDFYPRDPADWQLLGSNDGGKNWETLDVRRNETFPRRLQKRDFALQKPAFYAIYRLQIDSVFAPGLLANSVQLAEIEPHWAKGENTAGLSLVVSARGENAPWEVVQRAFDRDLTTKWLDFSRDSTNHASWVQWQFAAINGPPVVSLNRLQALRPQPTNAVKLDLQAVVVGYTSESMSLVDPSGFEVIHLTLPESAVRPGERVRLKGDLEFEMDKPLLMHPELTVLGQVPTAAPAQPGQPLEANQDYVLDTIEGDAEFLVQDSAYATVRLTSAGGANSVLARILNPNRRPLPNPLNCRLRVRGVVESVTDANGHPFPGIIWVSRLSDVALAAAKDKDWNQWPEYTVGELAGTNSIPQGLVRVIGTVDDQGNGRFTMLKEGTNRIAIFDGEASAWPRHSRVEAAGFLSREAGRTALRWAACRPAAEKALPAAMAIDAQHPVTDIGEVNRLRQINPDVVFPVRLRGVITYIVGAYINDDNVFYLQDGTNAIQLLNATAAGLTDALQQEGMYVEFAGLNSHDGIVPTSLVKFLGKGRMPEPMRNSFDAMMSPQNGGRWAQVEGVVSGYDDGRLTLLVEGKELTVWVNQITPGDQFRAPGSRLRVSGVCEQILNARDQMLGARLLVPSTECIEVINHGPADPFLLPKVAIASVLLSSPGVAGGQMQMVRIQGIVTYNGHEMLCLQDKDSGMRVFLQRESTGIEPGDQVEVAGLALPDGFTPKLVQALVRKTGRGDLPAAVVIDFTQNWTQSSQDATRGQVDAIFEGQGASPSALKLELRCEATKRDFYAFLPAAVPLPASLVPGTRVRLRGVIKFQEEEPLDANQVVTAFEMYLNSPADIQVLEAPSWWTARHTLWVVGGLGTVLVVSLGWISALRRQVRRQTRALEQENAERKRAEIFLNSVLQNLPIAVVIKEVKELRIVMLNKAYEELTGIPKAEALGKNDQDLALQSVADASMKHDRESIALNKLVETEEELNTRRKGKRNVEKRKLTILDEKGQPLCLMAILEDITQRKQAQTALAYERDLLRSLMDNSPDKIYFKDALSRYLRLSKSTREQLGVAAEQIVGKTDFDFFADSYANGSFADEQTILDSGAPLLGKIEREVGKDSDEGRWMLTSKMPLRDVDGKIIGTFGISKDITAIKEAEAKLEAVHKQLLDTSRLTGMAEVATSILHNVGNVLNSVGVSVTLVNGQLRRSEIANLRRAVAMLREKNGDLGEFLTTDPKGKLLPEYLRLATDQLADEQAQMIAEMESVGMHIEHIKEIVTMQQGYAKVSGAFENLPVSNLVEDALQMNAAAFARHNVQVVREMAQDAPTVCVDRHKVLQILINVLCNAKHAMDAQNPQQKQLGIRVEKAEPDRVKIIVRDNGIGIAPDHLVKIFTSGFTTKKDGHGFGLHSGANAAKEIGGSLTAQSEGVGLGASFILELPVASSRPTAPDDENGRQAVSSSNGRKEPSLAVEG
jgi:PAS domain S-box-containing protein